MEVKMGVKMGVKVDNTFPSEGGQASQTFVQHEVLNSLREAHNSPFNSSFNSPKRKKKMDNSFSRSFKDLECWQRAHEFVLAVYCVLKQFPEDERYGLTSQFRRAAVSIAANICEGYKKLSKADKLRFMNIAQGSLEECRYYIILSRDLKYIDQQTHDNLEYLINGVSWKLNGYAEGISNNAAIGD